MELSADKTLQNKALVNSKTCQQKLFKMKHREKND